MCSAGSSFAQSQDFGVELTKQLVGQATFAVLVLLRVDVRNLLHVIAAVPEHRIQIGAARFTGLAAALAQDLPRP